MCRAFSVQAAFERLLCGAIGPRGQLKFVRGPFFREEPMKSRRDYSGRLRSRLMLKEFDLRGAPHNEAGRAGQRY